jgi:hypothetical protein
VPRLLPRSKNLRLAVLVAASIIFVAVVAALLVNSANSGGNHKTAVHHPKSKPATPKTKNVKLVVGAVVVQNAGPPASVTSKIRTALMSATQRYFDDAIEAPLVHGTVDNGYEAVFDSGVKGPASGKDRAALTESATGVIRQPVKMLASSVRIDGLGDPTGKLALAATTFTFRATAPTPTGKLTIVRQTELTFANESGRWLVTAYHVGVVRTLGRTTTTTKAHAGTTA